MYSLTSSNAAELLDVNVVTICMVACSGMLGSLRVLNDQIVWIAQRGCAVRRHSPGRRRCAANVTAKRWSTSRGSTRPVKSGIMAIAGEQDGELSPPLAAEWQKLEAKLPDVPINHILPAQVQAFDRDSSSKPLVLVDVRTPEGSATLATLCQKTASFTQSARCPGSLGPWSPRRSLRRLVTRTRATASCATARQASAAASMQQSSAQTGMTCTTSRAASWHGCVED